MIIKEHSRKNIICRNASKQTEALQLGCIVDYIYIQINQRKATLDAGEKGINCSSTD